MAQVCCDPAEIAVIVFPASTPVVLTATGIQEFDVDEFPSWPELPSPQQKAAPLAMAQV